MLDGCDGSCEDWVSIVSVDCSSSSSFVSFWSLLVPRVDEFLRVQSSSSQDWRVLQMWSSSSSADSSIHSSIAKFASELR